MSTQAANSRARPEEGIEQRPLGSIGKRTILLGTKSSIRLVRVANEKSLLLLRKCIQGSKKGTEIHELDNLHT